LHRLEWAPIGPGDPEFVGPEGEVNPQMGTGPALRGDCDLPQPVADAPPAPERDAVRVVLVVLVDAVPILELELAIRSPRRIAG
jgi:hypothetical protein